MEGALHGFHSLVAKPQKLTRSLRSLVRFSSFATREQKSARRTLHEAIYLYLYLFLIVKCTSGGLHLKMFVSFIHLWNFGKISIFLASSGSFNVKNDNIHTFFPLLVGNFEFAGFATKQKYTGWTVSVLQNPDRERTNQSTGICLRLGLPYNNCSYHYTNPG